jgi:phage terminase large subunit-like protein
LRIGQPRVVVTTTPRTTPLIRDLANRDDGSVVLTRGSTFENEANLSPEAIAELKRRYEGTRLGRQELLGELIEDVEGALWTRDMLEHRARWAEGHPGC